MNRQIAYELLTRHLSSPNLLKHSLAAEAAMRALAVRMGEDNEIWGITGLLHDADYEKSKGHPELHGNLLFELEPNVIPSNIEHAIRSHNYQYTKVMPESLMDWAITCCDQLTGLIIASALILPDKKLASLTPEFVIKKMKQKGFAKGADRTQINLCEEKLGIPLAEFVAIVLTAMQQISPQLEL
ncbi:MAG TPA: HD domain-containing protein [Patescibacteria group bacterium]|nr:HD domain-containing protein [Patescibacteria group bacterium]